MLIVRKEENKVIAKDPIKDHELSGEIIRTRLNDFMIELSICKYADKDVAFKIKDVEMDYDGVPVVTIETEADTYKVPMWSFILIGSIYVAVKHTDNSKK
jgi:hypothetical protein